MSQGDMEFILPGALEDNDDMIDTPEGYESRTHPSHAAMFSWNPDKASSKMRLDPDQRICQATKANGFKSVLGT